MTLSQKILAPLLAPMGLSCLVFFTSCATQTSNGIGGNVQAGQSSPAIRAEGVKQFSEMKQKKKVSTNSAANAQLQRVGRRLAQVVPYPSSWEFVLFDDPSPNAFALPGGKVGIHTGILPITKNDAGLATVIGHEMAHVTGAHAESRLNKQKTISLGGALLNGVLQSQGIDGAGNLINMGSQVAFGLPHSRAHEYEADRVGILYMAKAGYDPRESVNFWQRFNATNKGQHQSELLSTHPVDSSRISALQKYMPTALQAYKN